MKSSCSAKRLFPSIPQINFLSKDNCDKCGIKLKMRKSGIKRIATLPIGEIDARELHMHCGPCVTPHFITNSETNFISSTFLSYKKNYNHIFQVIF